MISLRGMWLVFTSLAVPLAAAAPPDDVSVTSTFVEGQTALVARFRVDAPAPEIQALIEDVTRLPKTLPPISEAELLGPDILHLTIDLPWPLSQRDSVSRVTRSVEGNTIVFAWEPTDGPPPDAGVVRLVASRGQWRLTSVEGGTDVTYESWNQVAANVPEPIVRVIHKMEATRLANNLRAAVAQP